MKHAPVSPHTAAFLHRLLVPWWHEYAHALYLWLFAAAAVACFALALLGAIAELQDASS